jgi:hypothetical protein
VNSSSANLSINLQAAAPAGVDCDGAPRGTKMISPSLAYFQDLDGALALQGFVGNNLTVRSGWSDNLNRHFGYGVALTRPLPGLPTDNNQSVHVFVEALGRFTDSQDPTGRTPANFELLPGLHWRVGENWWMSGGLIVPVGAQRSEAGLWQLTCSWRF